jgi:hypothetical protein
VDAVVLRADHELGEDDGVLGVDCAVGNPVLPRQRRGRRYLELLCFLFTTENFSKSNG